MALIAVNKLVWIFNYDENPEWTNDGDAAIFEGDFDTVKKLVEEKNFERVMRKFISIDKELVSHNEQKQKLLTRLEYEKNNVMAEHRISSLQTTRQLMMLGAEIQKCIRNQIQLLKYAYDIYDPLIKEYWVCRELSSIKPMTDLEDYLNNI